ncbi:DUF3592 domain-containing protein [Haloplanus salilacus]|uniref:DUF3592 domain-containing protein n=1 Tax=Haloplanus salilacus TaxID=2949994 RepID=UPI0030D04C19
MEINGPSSPLGIALVILVGLGAVGYGAYSHTAQTSALDSPERVDATVVSASIETWSTNGVSYAPDVTYNYTYEGETYTSSNVYPGTLPKQFDRRGAAEEVLAAYESDETVRAYVPPDSPEGAYLERETNNKPFLVIGLGALFLLAGVRSALGG